MDKLTDYQTIVENYLDQVKAFYQSPESPTEFAVMSSHKNRHFQLLEFGHTDEDYVFTVYMHFHVGSDGLVTLIANNTEQEPFEQLIEAGVDKDDLRIGWLEPAYYASLERISA